MSELMSNEWHATLFFQFAVIVCSSYLYCVCRLEKEQNRQPIQALGFPYQMKAQ